MILFKAAHPHFSKLNEISNFDMSGCFPESHSWQKATVGYDKAGDTCTVGFFLLSSPYLVTVEELSIQSCGDVEGLG